jgi:hypothetical protein
MKLYIILLILAHFIGDWLFQTRYMALNKSKKFGVLLFHVILVSNFIGCVVLWHHNWHSDFAGPLLINGIAHGIIDWNIWKIYAKIRGDNAFELDYHSYVNGEPAINKESVKHDYYFYSTIALDQMLHLTLIILLFT